MSSTTTSSGPSLILPSIKPKTQSFNKPTSLSFFSFKATPSTSLSLKSFLCQQQHRTLRLSYRFVRNVAVSSDFEQEEEVFGTDGEEPSFSPDLKVFVGNLPFSVDSSQLADLFANVGNVEMVEVIYDKITGRSRGFGFVTMSTVEEAVAAAQQFNGYELEGRALRVNSGPPPQRETSFSRGSRGGETFDAANRIYVGNLSWGVDNLALETFFSEQGKVVEAKVVYDRESGRSRGFGFVTYSSAEEVDSAIESLNGVELDGRPVRVSVAEARPKRQF